ncbi:tetratricopeptide repeat protein [Streptomyces sp. HNM0575]|uniref:tetratricopeptide repeat protein n=1 Tax=Streptomyces sp. HNM0575 TaxID=2716338 RepID=UPI00145FC578|nr:tetratricopeptide repeat protein [Streptomyces sp. HNM0575]NLU74147.1 tetratricopeptide repeat protein [Streptomyces sp. HNM0575]
MKRRYAALAGAVAVGACAAGLLTIGPYGPGGDASRPGPGSLTAQSRDRTGTGAGSGTDEVAGGTGADPLRAARRAVDKAPQDPVVWSELGQALIERARTTLDSGRLDAAGKALRRSLDLKRTGNYAATTGMGQLADARHEFGTGRKWGLRSTRMAPDRAAGYGVLADAEIQLGHYRAARTAVQRMLDLKPTAAAYSRAAYDLETHGRNRDAAVALRRAVEAAQTPDETAFAESRMGELAWSRGELKSAGRHFERALDAVHGHPYSLAGRARLQAARGHRAQALRTYGRLVERTPLPQFLLEAAELRGSRPGGRDRKALAALKAQARMLRADGGPVDPHLALYEADHGRPATAVAMMRREWKRSHGVIVADALGWALHRAGRDAEALRYAEAAARTGWKNALFHYHRGVIEHRLGRHAAGDRHLRRALRLNPHFSPLHAPRAVRLLHRSGGPATGDGDRR